MGRIRLVQEPKRQKVNLCICAFVQSVPISDLRRIRAKANATQNTPLGSHGVIGSYSYRIPRSGDKC
jgi:hypothetical protein